MPLFDTNFLIDLTRGDSGAVVMAKRVDDVADVKSISVVTVQEYLRGVFYHHTGKKSIKKKLQKALADLAHFEQLEFTASIAREAAVIDANLFKNGTMIPYADVIIAATATHHNIPLVTRDSHFQAIEGLMVIDY